MCLNAGDRIFFDNIIIVISTDLDSAAQWILWIHCRDEISGNRVIVVWIHGVILEPDSIASVSDNHVFPKHAIGDTVEIDARTLIIDCVVFCTMFFSKIN